MNKILEEFKRIKTERNQFINETNKKGEFLLSQAKNKFDSVHNTIFDKNINNKNIKKENEYLDLVKTHLSKSINLNEQIFSYNLFFNNCYQDIILFIENKIKDILNKYNEKINEEEDYEYIQNIIQLANLTKILAEENKDLIKGESNQQKEDLLIQLKENLNIINNTLSPQFLSSKKNNKSIIDNISKILNYLAEYIIFIYNDINSINSINLNLNFNDEGNQNYISNYLLNAIFNNKYNSYYNTKKANNSKIWKLIITKNKNKEITLSQSNFKVKNKSIKIPKNYSIHIFIEKSRDINKTIELMKCIMTYVKNKIMVNYVITNNFRSKLEGYYCFEIFGIGKRKKKIIESIKNKMERINKKVKYNDISIMIKISRFNDLDVLMKKKFFSLLKKEFNKVNKEENNKNIISVNYLMNLVENDIHHNFSENSMKKYLNPKNII